MKVHPQVTVKTQNITFKPGVIQGPVMEVFVDGEPFPVTAIGWKGGMRGDLSEITLSFFGKLEIIPA